MPSFYRSVRRSYGDYANFLQETTNVLKNKGYTWDDVKSIQLGSKKRLSIKHFKELAKDINYNSCTDDTYLDNCWGMFEFDIGSKASLKIFLNDGSYMIRAKEPRADDGYYIGDVFGWLFIDMQQPDMSLEEDDTIDKSELIGKEKDDDDDENEDDN